MCFLYIYAAHYCTYIPSQGLGFGARGWVGEWGEGGDGVKVTVNSCARKSRVCGRAYLCG